MFFDESAFDTLGPHTSRQYVKVGTEHNVEELYNVALCYDADPGTGGDSKRRRSPGDIAPPLGGWEGLNPHG